MSNNQFIEHLDLLTSMGVNTARKAFLPFGRYYGFDTKAAGTIGAPTGFPVNITHSSEDLMHYTDSSDADQTAAVLVSRHGAVLLTSDVVELEVFPHATETRYVVVYAKYPWVTAVDGGSVSFGTLPLVVDEPTDPYDLTGLADNEFPIGYFTLSPGTVGGYSLSDLSWTPWEKPNLAQKPEMDTSDFAKLSENNKFTKGNAFADSVALTQTALVDEGGGYYRLELPNTSNVFTLTLPIDTTWNIQRIVTSLDENGQPLILTVKGGATVKWYYGSPNGVIIPNGFNTSSGQITTYFFWRIAGDWQVISQPTSYTEQLTSILSTLGSLTTIQQQHSVRISALEATALSWVDITPNPALSGWVFAYLQYAVTSGRIVVRGSVTIPAGSRPPLNTSVSVVTTIPVVETQVIAAGVWDTSGNSAAYIRVTTSGIQINLPSLDGTSTLPSDVPIQFYADRRNQS